MLGRDREIFMYDYDIGRFKITLEFRDVGTDRGLSIHVYGPVDGNIEEVLRSDCFDNLPHYHTAFSYRKTPRIPIDHSDPFGWAMGNLRANTNQLLRDASADEMNQNEITKWVASLDEVENTGRQILSQPNQQPEPSTSV